LLNSGISTSLYIAESKNEAKLCNHYIQLVRKFDAEAYNDKRFNILGNNFDFNVAYYIFFANHGIRFNHYSYILITPHYNAFSNSGIIKD